MPKVGDILNIPKCRKYFLVIIIGVKPHYCGNTVILDVFRVILNEVF